MIGSDYISLEEFVNACRKDRSVLLVSDVLSKIYKVNTLRKIAIDLDINISEASGVGRNATYSTAEIIANTSSASVIGNILSRNDHDLNFPVITYYQIPENFEIFSSYNNFKGALNNFGVTLDNGLWQSFNGLTEPASHYCALESVREYDANNVISLLFSCSRALVRPNINFKSYEDLFLSRIPILVRLFFELHLVEFSMPLYSEPIANSFGYEYQSPKRYQQAFDTAKIVLQEISGVPLASIRFSDLPKWLEQYYNAEDMGWKILPQDGADFDLTQNYIPLKNIIDDFMSSLDKKCALLGRQHKLHGIDLYHIFRSLQEDSHTHTIVQRISLGAKRGNIVLAVFFGTRDAMYYPIILIEREPSYAMLDKLRNAVSLLSDAVINDKYTINSLLV